jgi:hypothetical protein
MQIYEAIRRKEHGTMMGVHVSLQAMLFSEYSEKFEMLVVEVKISNKEVRVITAYGPQENVSIEERMPFFATLEEEIVSAYMSNKSIIIQMDANSKLGKEIVPNDCHEQTPNGAALAGVVKRNALIVINGLNKGVKGAVTRRRITVNSREESIIDFVMISPDLLNEFEEMVVDEEKNYALTKIIKRKANTVMTQSDHNVMISKFSMTWNNEETKKEEVLNLKDKECQKRFKDETTNTKKLSEVFDTEEDLEKQTKKFLKRLNKVLFEKCTHKC